MKDHRLIYIKSLFSEISCLIFNTYIDFIVKRDVKSPETGRIFIQTVYNCKDSKEVNARAKVFKGRKWYLSDHMLEDEIIKTAYLAFETCVKHEMLEGFRVGHVTLFNPHVDYKELLKISNKEVKR